MTSNQLLVKCRLVGHWCKPRSSWSYKCQLRLLVFGFKFSPGQAESPLCEFGTLGDPGICSTRRWWWQLPCQPYNQQRHLQHSRLSSTQLSQLTSSTVCRCPEAATTATTWVYLPRLLKLQAALAGHSSMDVALPSTLCVTDYIIFAVGLSSYFIVLCVFGLTGCCACLWA